MFVHRRHLSRRVRLFTLLLCALALVIQPVFASVGELHELAQHTGGAHVSLLHNAAAVATDQAPDSTETLLLHALVECAHYAGPGVAVAPTVTDLPAAPNVDVWVAHVPAAFSSRRTAVPFKPPRVA